MLRSGGLLLSLAILLVFIVSTRRFVQWVSPTDTYAITLGQGYVAFLWTPPPLRQTSFTGWSISGYSGPVPLSSCFGWFGFRSVPPSCLAVPLWLLFLCMAVATAVLWLPGRRYINPDHCQNCGYNLTGNVSGRCPECGSPA
jgi:hypothetical protein